MGAGGASGERARVAVLGGGPGALSAAFELSATPELRARYEVTVHQLGWRLGGKGASGRNARHGQRIEEHGLHIWFGFYDNAFDVIRRCYQELDRPTEAPLARWDDAFKPRDDCVQFERFRDEWIPHTFVLPGNPLTPGDHVEIPFWEPVRQTFEFFERELHRLHREHADAFGAAAPPTADRSLVAGLAERLGADARKAEHAAGAELLRLGHQLARAHAEGPGGKHEDRDLGAAGHLLCAVRDWLWKHVVSERVDHTELRMFFMWVDLAACVVTGIAADDLRARGFGAINDEELRGWLARHGASELTLTASPLVRAVYDAAFCFLEGDVRRPDVAAGKAVQDLIRSIFLYKGALMYKMQAGMGDTVFSPLYEVLRQRGVRFEFFHCVTGLGVDGDGIGSIDVIEQATPVAGEYRPLVEVAGLPCWPSEPDLAQLADADSLHGADFEAGANPLGRTPRTLRRGHDFDAVVLGIPVGALPPICGELAEASPRFGEMLEHSCTVMTQAFQLWVTEDAAALGWEHRPGTLASCYVEPVDTYCDMTHLLPREEWGGEVKHIAYFCGVLPDSGFASQAEADAHVERATAEYLRSSLPALWPDFDERMLAGTYTRANWTGTERYALTPAGEVRFRLWPDESGFDNLVLAGDWTRNGIDGGSVEAAVTSGKLAARAISGSPAEVRGTTSWLESDRGDEPA